MADQREEIAKAVSDKLESGALMTLGAEMFAGTNLDGYSAFIAPGPNENFKPFGVARMAYTSALVVGINETGYERRYCYEKYTDAMIAFFLYKGEGDPVGPWIKEKPGDRLGPGATHEIGCVCEQCSVTREQDRRDPRG